MFAELVEAVRLEARSKEQQYRGRHAVATRATGSTAHAAKEQGLAGAVRSTRARARKLRGDPLKAREALSKSDLYPGALQLKYGRNTLRGGK